MLISWAMAGVNHQEMKRVRTTIGGIAVECPARREAQRQGIGLDKAYDFQKVRDPFAEFGLTPNIRARGEKAKRSNVKLAS